MLDGAFERAGAVNRIISLIAHHRRTGLQSSTRDGYGNITSAQRADGTKNRYGYNPAGEVVADRKLRDEAGNEFLRGQSFRWSYDGIGNRLSASAGGDANGLNLRVTSYTPNALNQSAAIQHPGAADVIGVANGQAAVTLNGAAVARQGDWFHGEVTADNSSGPVWQAATVSDGTDSNAGSLLIPPVSHETSDGCGIRLLEMSSCRTKRRILGIDNESWLCQ